MTGASPRAPAGRAAAALLCVFLLAACDSLSPWPRGGAGEAAAGGTAGAPAPIAESAEAGPLDEAAESEAQVTAVVPTRPKLGVDDNPDQLMGMSPLDLSGFLGAPELIRRESPASIWQYRAEHCVLDVVMYPEQGADRVSYFEARQDGLTKMPARDCLNQLLRERHGATAG